MGKFRHLDVPRQWTETFTKYPHGLTIFEALVDWTSQVDKMVDNVNDWNEYLDGFVDNFEFELQEEVQSTITKWQNEGLLDVIIESALDTELDNVKTQLAERVTKDEFNEHAVSITSLGSVGDWDGETGTDNTLTFKSALQLALALGTDLYIPHGAYYLGTWEPFEITKPIRIYGKGRLIGNGEEFVTLKSDFRLDGLHFENWSNIVSTDGTTDYIDEVSVTNCKAENISRLFYSSLNETYPNSKIRKIIIKDNKIKNSSQKATIIILSPQFDSAYIENNYIENPTQQAIRIGDNYGQFFHTRKRVFIHNNVILNLQGDGPEPKQILVYADQVEIIGNQLEGTTASTSQNEGIYTKARYCKIVRNTLRDVGYQGGEGMIVVKGATTPSSLPPNDDTYGYNTIISQNHIINTRDFWLRAINTQTTHLLINGNITEGIKGGEYIRATGTAKSIVITENMFFGQCHDGIRFPTSAENIVVTNNVVDNCTYACITTGGTFAKNITINGNQLFNNHESNGRVFSLYAEENENVFITNNFIANSDRGFMSSTGLKNILFMGNILSNVDRNHLPIENSEKKVIVKDNIIA